MKKSIVIFLIIFAAAGAFAEPKIDISGTVEWDTMRLNAQVSLDLASAGIKLPTGRTQAESLLNTGFLNLIQPSILELRVDSSTTIGDLLKNGEINQTALSAIAQRANSVAPSMQSDMKKMQASHSISLADISSSFISHSRPAAVTRTLNPVSTAQYTGIIIIATERLPVHGSRNTALAVPCLFPKIWDSEMNLIYDRNMLEIRNTTMVKYSVLQNIFQNNPSGLSPELREVAGDRPLRIFARGVFGINPTDIIIDRSDAMLIISSEENRRLLSQGRVVIILDESVLKHNLTANN